MLEAVGGAGTLAGQDLLDKWWEEDKRMMGRGAPKDDEKDDETAGDP